MCGRNYPGLSRCGHINTPWSTQEQAANMPQKWSSRRFAVCLKQQSATLVIGYAASFHVCWGGRSPSLGGTLQETSHGVANRLLEELDIVTL